MNIDLLKTFCDLVDTGSFSKAAEANFVSQSAVSQQLAKLEKELATQLISRGGGMLSPTESGKAFYKGSKEIIRRYEQLQGEVKSASNAIRGVLRVGTIYSVGFYLLDPYVRTFLASHPEVNLHVEYTGWNTIYASVISGEMDMGIVACPSRQRSIEILPLAGEQLVVVCPPDHPFREKTVLYASDLSGQRFVAFERNIPTRRLIDRQLKNEKVQVDVVMEFDNIELLKRAIMIGNGISILPKDNIVREAAYGDLAYVPLNNSKRWQRPLAVVRRRGKIPSPAEKIFLGLLMSRVKNG